MSSAPPLSRRQAALSLLAAALSGTLAGCDSPEEEILPYVEQPERVLPGRPLRFATTLPLNGFGRGVVCESYEGRPVKVSGNALHPASLGATDVFAEADILTLYDPDRSRAISRGGVAASWGAMLAALLPRLDGDGDGVRLLTGPVTSPTLLRLIGQMRARWPNFAWHAHVPIDADHARRGAELAYGRPLTLRPRLDRAAVVVALGADPLGPGPDQIQSGRAFAAKRKARAGHVDFLRLYAVEPATTLTGANADHQRLVSPAELHDMTLALGAALGAPVQAPSLAGEQQRLVDAMAADLRAHRGAALVLAGEMLPPELHALAHWMNAGLDAPVEAIAPVWPPADTAPEDLGSLVDAMRDGAVRTLLILDCNPVYSAPADLDVADALQRVPFSLHHGLYRDETAALCTWHVPAPHALEDWGDLRAPDGTASFVQPLIRPLYDTTSAARLLGVLLGDPDASSRAALRAAWADMPEEAWRRALEDGVVAGSAAPGVDLPAPQLPPMPGPAARVALTLVLRPDASVWDGSFANNAWLQECPRPLTRQVWGNAALVAPEEASERGLARGDMVRLEAAGRTLDLPVLPQQGIARGVVVIALGYGRKKAGAIGDGIGADAYHLRTRDAPWVLPDVALTKRDGTAEVILAQEHQRLEGEARELLPIEPVAAALRSTGTALDHEVIQPSLYPAFSYDGNAWAMVIDTTLCIGCNACVVACQAENNIPVVGPDEVSRGRDMHWLRIDTYVQAVDGEERPGFQPVPCMHCEKAPCEPVCPVAASVHDHDGLNLQVYNRCIGTRFCQSNCPYKVRRFNFYGYAEGQEYKNLGAPVVAAQRNPEVTVRARGVMEKCTYCVQRISAAHRAAAKDDRPIGEGEVVTACQSACPTTAIQFGDLNQPGSAPAQLRQEPHHYALLGHLGTRPRTTYLKRLRNPNPAVET